MLVLVLAAIVIETEILSRRNRPRQSGGHAA
jgi:hypothetical protein